METNQSERNGNDETPKTHQSVPIKKKNTKVYRHYSREGNAEDTYVNGVQISGNVNTA